jgi:hypothetical protein
MGFLGFFMDLGGSLDMDGSSRILVVLRIWMVFVGLGWFFQGIRLFFRRTIIQLIHILVRAEDADVTGKRNYFYLVSLYWANLRSKKDIFATLS